MNYAVAYPNQYQHALGQQWSEMNQQSLNQAYAGGYALGQQWLERSQQQFDAAQLAKCQEAREDHLDNALRFAEWAIESFNYDPQTGNIQTINRIKPVKREIDYLAITREVCGG